MGAAAGLPAVSYARVLGANDRIQIGLLGCGHRSSGHRIMLKKSAATDPNFEVRSVCDLWSVNRERAAADVRRLFGNDPRRFQYSEEMLADKDLDAVMIGTGDHQHARLLAEVVRAGKDCYCEKPMANTLEDAKLARDAVWTSRQVVQMGSQWLSCPYQQQVREIVRSGKLGKIVAISQSWNFNGPRWHVPKSENVAAIREQDTDWNRWLLGRPATFDLRTGASRPAGWTSGDAAGLPVFPAAVRYDECERGLVEHAMRFTVRRSRRAYIYPATHFASRYTDPDLPRMGGSGCACAGISTPRDFRRTPGPSSKDSSDTACL